jgi:ferredoxin-NADP reductase
VEGIGTATQGTFSTRLLSRTWLTPRDFEVEVERPAGFVFQAGQGIRFGHKDRWREYTIVSAADSPALTLCIRHVAGGGFTPHLATAPLGVRLEATGPHGYFLHTGSDARPAVFVATGVGIAPFVAMTRFGVRGFTLLHGVRTPDELHYASPLRSAAARYVPCVTGAAGRPQVYSGRVTGYLRERLDPGVYDFYLCGRRQMIGEVTLLVDELFPGSSVRTEAFV